LQLPTFAQSTKTFCATSKDFLRNRQRLYAQSLEAFCAIARSALRNKKSLVIVLFFHHPYDLPKT
jgi:hypothetical protein